MQTTLPAWMIGICVMTTSSPRDPDAACLALSCRYLCCSEHRHRLAWLLHCERLSSRGETYILDTALQDLHNHLRIHTRRARLSLTLRHAHTARRAVLPLALLTVLPLLLLTVLALAGLLAVLTLAGLLAVLALSGLLTILSTRLLSVLSLTRLLTVLATGLLSVLSLAGLLAVLPLLRSTARNGRLPILTLGLSVLTLLRLTVLSLLRLTILSMSRLAVLRLRRLAVLSLLGLTVLPRRARRTLRWAGGGHAANHLCGRVGLGCSVSCCVL